LWSGRFVSSSFTRKQIKKIVEIYEVMNSVLNSTQIQRILIFKVHNGGNFIRPSSGMYVSVIYEDYRSPFSSVKEKYQKIPIDREYAKMLLEVMENKKCTFETDKLRDGLLKDIYIADGVKKSVISLLKEEKKAIYFCSMATSQIGEFTMKEKLDIDIAINKIKNNLR